MPAISVEVTLTAVMPNGNCDPLAAVEATAGELGQLSVDGGMVNVGLALQREPVDKRIAAGHVSCGISKSTTSTKNEHEVVRLETSTDE